MKKRIEQLEQELAELKKQLEEHGFSEGDWLISDKECHLVRFLKYTAKTTFTSSEIIGSCTYHTGWDAKAFRKATPEEIENALIEEAKRRYNVPCKVNFLDNRKRELKGFSLSYNPKNDSLTATGSYKYLDNQKDFVYQKGKWAEIIEENTKFFEWDVDYPESPFDIELVTIGCTQFDKNFLVKMEHALGYLTDYSVQEVIDELQKLDL